jgi:hypothetical protein
MLRVDAALGPRVPAIGMHRALLRVNDLQGPQLR